MKNVYMSQPNRCVGKNIYLPYASGALVACAQTDPSIRENYTFRDIFFTFEDIDKRITGMNKPFLVGFSCYIWNYEYNLKFAGKLKEAFPECHIVFGGHNVNAMSSDLWRNAFIRFLYMTRGNSFQKLLLADRVMNFSACESFIQKRR